MIDNGFWIKEFFIMSRLAIPGKFASYWTSAGY